MIQRYRLDTYNGWQPSFRTFVLYLLLGTSPRVPQPAGQDGQKLWGAINVEVAVVVWRLASSLPWSRIPFVGTSSRNGDGTAARWGIRWGVGTGLSITCTLSPSGHDRFTIRNA